MNVGVVLFPLLFAPATLVDCDKAWKARGEQPPAYAIVLNQTIVVKGHIVWRAECWPLSPPVKKVLTRGR